MFSHIYGIFKRCFNFLGNLTSNDIKGILQTPLFKVRTQKETVYCMDESEKNRLISGLKTKYEVTRFKGLGELGSSEIKPYIHDSKYLLPVYLNSMKEVKELLGFYMGRNTPQRKTFIVDNMILRKTQKFGNLVYWQWRASIVLSELRGESSRLDAVHAFRLFSLRAATFFTPHL